MRTRLPPTPAERTLRKQDLLLASALARNQATAAIDQISRRADGVVAGMHQLRAWMTSPQVGTVAGVAASMAALLALRHVRGFRLLRWALLAWRVGKLGLGLLPSRRPAR